MKAAVGVSLGLLFVALATLNIITIFESSRPERAPRMRSLAITLHRIGGYLFIGLYAAMVWFMSKRLIGSTGGLPGEAVIHIALALLLAPLLLVKVMIARRYKNHHAMLLPLGLSIFAISAVLVSIRALPYILGLISPGGAAVRYSSVALLLFFLFLASLALRPVGTSNKASLRSSSSQPALPFAQPRSETFPLTLVRVQAQTHDAKTFLFRVPQGRYLRAKPGQFLTFHFDIDGQQVIRSYSICSSPMQTDHVEITAKRAANGRGSVFLNDRATSGLVVQAHGPSGKFYFDEALHSEIVLIAAGSGITPMLAMLRYIEDRRLSTSATLIYCVRTPQDIIFQQELARLSRSLSNFRYVISVSTPDASWAGSRGRFSKALLLEQELDFRKPTFFLCGPKPFMQHASTLLKEEGVDDDRIKQESFGGRALAMIPKANGEPSSGNVEFSRSGVRCELNPNKTILELSETVGVPISYSCRQGQCGTCATRLLRGNVTMDAEDGLSLKQKQAGFILPCVSRATDSIALDA